MTITQITPLRSDEWERARARAETIIRARLVPPDRRRFLAHDAKYPPLVFGLSIALLVIVAVAAFVISAGKQIAAFDVINQRLAVDYASRLSGGYVDSVLIAALALSEFAVILFGLGAKAVATTVTAERLLRGFQLVSIAIAIGGNLTVFGLAFTPQAWAFDLLVTIAAPLIVIGVGLLIEQMAHEAITRRRDALAAYHAALDKFEAARATPAEHEDWFAVWGVTILEALRASESNRLIIDELIEADPTKRQDIVLREYKRNKWEFDPGAVSRLSTDVKPVIDVKPPSEKELRIERWLIANPGRVKDGSRALAAEIGDVSHDLVNDVRNRLSTNGHVKGE